MIIYKATNLINKKVYIGLTTKSLKRRKQCHYTHINDNFKFHQALKKYNKNNFIWEEIDNASNIEELKEKEKYWIEKYDSYNNGYNSTLGGDGGGMLNKKHSNKTKQNLSNKMKGENNPFYNKKHTDKTKNTLKHHFLTAYDEIKLIFENEQYKLITIENHYSNSKECVEVICPNGHNWSIRPYAFKRGNRCPICQKIKSRVQYEDILEEFNKYNYNIKTTKQEYENCKNSGKFKFNIICDKGHESEMLFHNFKQGHRCKFCEIENRNVKGKNSPIYKNINEEMKQEIIKLYKDGNSMLEIKRKTSLDNRLIKRRLIEWGII